MQILWQIVPGRGLVNLTPAGAHGRSAVQVRVLRQGVQAAPPHEGPLSGAHGGEALPLCAVWKDVLPIDDTESARKDSLPKIRAQVLVSQPARRRRGESALAVGVRRSPPTERF